MPQETLDKICPMFIVSIFNFLLTSRQPEKRVSNILIQSLPPYNLMLKSFVEEMSLG